LQKVDIFFVLQFIPGGHEALRRWVSSARNFELTWWSGDVPSPVTQ